MKWLKNVTAFIKMVGCYGQLVHVIDFSKCWTINLAHLILKVFEGKVLKGYFIFLYFKKLFTLKWKHLKFSIVPESSENSLSILSEWKKKSVIWSFFYYFKDYKITNIEFIITEYKRKLLDSLILCFRNISQCLMSYKLLNSNMKSI